MRHQLMRQAWGSETNSTPASNGDSSVGTFSPSLWSSPGDMGALIRHTIEEKDEEGSVVEPIAEGTARGRRRGRQPSHNLTLARDHPSVT